MFLADNLLTSKPRKNLSQISRAESFLLDFSHQVLFEIDNNSGFLPKILPNKKA